MAAYVPSHRHPTMSSVQAEVGCLREQGASQQWAAHCLPWGRSAGASLKVHVQKEE